MGKAANRVRSQSGQFLADDPVTRFWSKVDKTTTCWLWVGTRHYKGYGDFAPSGQKKVKAHRYSWELHKGKIPNGMQVLHRCDNPPCVNPDHLFIGTNRDNVSDAIAKGRHVMPRMSWAERMQRHALKTITRYLSA